MKSRLDFIADSVLLDSELPQKTPLPSLAMAGSPEVSLLCAVCWGKFDGITRTSCPHCGSPRPVTGWPSLPYSFRDRYLFWKLLGRGGMGTVFLAYDEHQVDESRRAVAVKVVPSAGSPAVQSALKRMFEREAAAAAMLAQSPDFVRVTSHDVGVEPAYIVMEYVDWPTLRGLLRRGPGEVQPLSPVKAARIGCAVLRGLSTMHFHRIVHRDLKPDNVFVRRSKTGDDYEVKILDLGVWTFDAYHKPHGSVPVERQDDGAPVGTFAYMSPEQMSLQPVGASSDIHTVGSLIWEMVTGRVPYPLHHKELAPAMRDRLDRLKSPPIKPVRMPEGLYEILCKALAYESQDRWRSADEMKAALRAWLAETLRRTRAAVLETKERLLVLETETETLRTTLAPAAQLIVELEALRDRLRADQRHAEEASLEALAEAQRESDRVFHALSKRMTAFAESVQEGVAHGAEATGDLLPMEVGPDGTPVLPGRIVSVEPEIPAALPPPTVSTTAPPSPPEPPPASAPEAPEAPPTPESAPTIAPAAPAHANHRVIARAAVAAILIGVGVATGAALLELGKKPPPPPPPPPPAATPAAAPPRAPDVPLDEAVDGVLGPGHVRGPVAVAWAGDGGTLATASGDGVVRVFDATTGAAAARLSLIEGGPVHAIRWAKAGDTLYAVSADGQLRAVSLDGRVLAATRAHEGAARALAIGDGGHSIVSGGDDGRVRVWSAGSLQSVATLERPAPRRGSAPSSAAVRALAAAGTRVVAAFADGEVIAWTDGKRPELITRLGRAPTRLAITQDGAALAIGSEGGQLTLFDGSGKLKKTLEAHQGPVGALSFSSDGRRLASAGADRGVTLWDVESGARVASLLGAQAVVSDLELGRGGAALLAGDGEGATYLWEVQSGGLTRKITPRAGPIRTLGVDGVGQAVVIGPGVWRVDLASGARSMSFDDAGTSVATEVALGPGARQGVILSGQQAQPFDIATGVRGRAIRVPPGTQHVAIAGDASWVAASGVDRVLRVWSSATGAPRFQADLGGVTALAPAPDGKSLAAVGGDANLRIIRAEDGSRDASVAVGRAPLGAVAWSPDGSRVAVGAADGRVYLYERAARELRAVRDTPDAAVEALAFAPDGKALAIGGRSRTVELRPLDGAPPRRFADHALSVGALAFAPDGKRLLAGVADGTVHIHELEGADSRVVTDAGGRWVVIDVHGHATCAPGPCP